MDWFYKIKIRPSSKKSIKPRLSIKSRFNKIEISQNSTLLLHNMLKMYFFATHVYDLMIVLKAAAEEGLLKPWLGPVMPYLSWTELRGHSKQTKTVLTTKSGKYIQIQNKISILRISKYRIDVEKSDEKIQSLLNIVSQFYVISRFYDAFGVDQHYTVKSRFYWVVGRQQMVNKIEIINKIEMI